MSSDADGATEVASESADVRAARAVHDHVELDRIVAATHLAHVESRHRDAAGFQLDVFAGAGEVVGATARDLDGRDGAGHLLDVAGEGGDTRRDGLVGHGGDGSGIRPGRFDTVGVVAVGGDLPADGLTRRLGRSSRPPL